MMKEETFFLFSILYIQVQENDSAFLYPKEFVKISTVFLAFRLISFQILNLYKISEKSKKKLSL